MYEWERKLNEGSKAHFAFRIYCSLGENRSLEKVSQSHAKSIPLLKEWSSQWAWVLRSKAYDKHLANIEQQAKEEAIRLEVEIWANRREEQREREWQLAEELLARAREMLKHPLYQQTTTDKGITVIEPVKWSLTDVAKFVDLAIKLGRLATGMNTNQKKVTVDYSALTDEELEQLSNIK